METDDSQTQTETPEVAEVRGLKAELAAFAEDAISYLKIRGNLFSIEAKEAGQIYGKKLGLVTAGGVMVLFGYFLLLAGGIGIIGAALDPVHSISLANWIGGAFVLAAAHLLPGFIFLRAGLKTKVDQRFFEYSLNEFKKEQEWLRQKKRL